MAVGVDTKMGEVTASNKEFHEGEPVFVLRAQDPLAPEAIRRYAAIAENAGCDDNHIKTCIDAADRMEKWQGENMDKVKELPDS